MARRHGGKDVLPRDRAIGPNPIHPAQAVLPSAVQCLAASMVGSTSCALHAPARWPRPKSIRTIIVSLPTLGCPRQFALLRPSSARFPPAAWPHKWCASAAFGRRHVCPSSSPPRTPPRADCPSCTPLPHPRLFVSRAVRGNRYRPRNRCISLRSSALRNTRSPSAGTARVPLRRWSLATNASAESADPGSANPTPRPHQAGCAPTCRIREYPIAGDPRCSCWGRRPPLLARPAPSRSAASRANLASPRR